MPYPSNSPRMEFSNADRTSLYQIAQASSDGLKSLYARNLIQRVNFDLISQVALTLNPTWNYNPPPLPDVR